MTQTPIAHARHEPIYGNWVMLHPDGSEMCRMTDRRANWYLNRKLGTIVSIDPPKFQLNFVPAGKGHHGDQYHLSQKENKCVICGTILNLTTHHVVPHFYRRSFPDNYKKSQSHDVLIACCECHAKYEREADALSEQIAQEMGIPRNSGTRTAKDVKTLWCVARDCKTLAGHADKIPVERQLRLLQRIANHIGYMPDIKLIPRLSEEYDSRWRGSYDDNNHGFLVVQKLLELDGLNEFVVRWRRHFIEKAQPKYLPDGWSITRKAQRD